MSFNRHKEIATKFPKFQTEAAMRFYPLVKKRVDDYFKEKGISPSANTQMHIKSIALLLMYLVPFVLILTLNTPLWAFYALWAFMGLGMAGVGMGVMHDGNHGSYSNKSWVNNLTGASMFLLSGNVVTWKIQHNVLHHTYTNIHGHDEDVETGGLIRLHSGSEWKKAHKYQHLYAPFLYGLMTLNWLLVKDFKQMGLPPRWVVAAYQCRLQKGNENFDHFKNIELFDFHRIAHFPIGTCLVLRIVGYCIDALCGRSYAEFHISISTRG